VADLEMEPMVPGFRQLLPQIVVSGILPVIGYALLHPHISSDAVALSIVSVFPVGQILWDRARHGRRDPVSIIILAAIVIGVFTGLVLHGGTLILKIRQSSFTGLFGLACLVSLGLRRPLMFVLARDFATGGDPTKRQAFDGQWQVPSMPRRFRFVTAVWGVGLVIECALQVSCALALPTQAYLVVGQVISWGFLAALITFSVVTTRRGEAYALELLEELGGAVAVSAVDADPVVDTVGEPAASVA
jgi:hypothetical protein